MMVMNMMMINDGELMMMIIFLYVFRVVNSMVDPRTTLTGKILHIGCLIVGDIVH